MHAFNIQRFTCTDITLMKKIILPLVISSFFYVGSAFSEEAVEKKSDEEMRLQEVVDKAFKAAVIEQIPMSSDKINKYQKDLEESSVAINPEVPPKMINRSQNVSLDPGAEPVKLRLAPGYVSSLVIVDSTGAPWPIATATPGKPSAFSVVKPETGAKNLITVSPLKNHVTSNIAITLEGRDAPLIVQLIMNDDDTDKKAQEADIVISMRVNRPGPNAAPPVLGAKINGSISSDLMSFLDGVPPPGASIVRLRDAPEGVQVWSLKSQLYLRTPYPARWPAWVQQASSSSGVSVYVMPLTSEIILSVNGASHTVPVLQ